MPSHAMFMTGGMCSAITLRLLLAQGCNATGNYTMAFWPPDCCGFPAASKRGSKSALQLAPRFPVSLDNVPVIGCHNHWQHNVRTRHIPELCHIMAVSTFQDNRIWCWCYKTQLLHLRLTETKIFAVISMWYPGPFGNCVKLLLCICLTGYIWLILYANK